ncbi:29722_t:CDS:2, partial [Gigaspora margarita]
SEQENMLFGQKFLKFGARKKIPNINETQQEMIEDDPCAGC